MVYGSTLSIPYNNPTIQRTDTYIKNSPLFREQGPTASPREEVTQVAQKDNVSRTILQKGKH